jgi:hypothetical protein
VQSCNLLPIVWGLEAACFVRTGELALAAFKTVQNLHNLSGYTGYTTPQKTVPHSPHSVRGLRSENPKSLKQYVFVRSHLYGSLQIWASILGYMVVHLLQIRYCIIRILLSQFICNA